MKVALVYDRVNKWGGAERTLLALNELFPKAPLYTAVYSAKRSSWAKVFPEIIPTFLQKIPLAKDRHELLGTFTPFAFETLNFDKYDLVVSVSSEAAKGIITKPGTRHISYCLTPTRYLWSGYDDYFKNSLLRMVSKPAIYYLRQWDKMAGARPDEIIAISSSVKRRIKKYYQRDSKIIHPPVDIKTFVPKDKKKEFFLVVSRLVPYKKVDLVIDAFNELKLPLVIVGSGSQEKYLKLKAKRNISFVGQLTDRELVNYYNRAYALIYAQVEDFGLTAVEAQACGTPVIALRKGGAKDSVIEGKTGVFFNKQKKESLIEKIKTFQKMSFREEDLVNNAKRFSKEEFKIKFKNLIKNDQ